MKCSIVILAFACIIHLDAVWAAEPAADMLSMQIRYAIKSHENIVYCLVGNNGAETVDVAPDMDVDDNHLDISVNNHVVKHLVMVLHHWRRRPDDWFVKIRPKESASFAFHTASTQSPWEDHWHSHGRCEVLWHIQDRWTQKYDARSPGLPMLFLEEGDTRPLSDDTGDMLDALCVDGRFDEDALAVPARRFKTAERQAEKKAYSPVIRIFSPSLGWETNMVFQPSHLSRDSSLPRREDVVFLSWNALFSCLSASERERLSGHNDVDVQWFDGEMRSRVLPLWIVPDPRPERESDYIWDENELMSLLGVSREYIEESRRNGYLDVIVPTLIKEGKLHAEKKDTSP